MQFPIELVESVIDASVAHHPTLSACSLVCKQWLPRCRHHLFSTLDLSADWTPEPNSVTNLLALLLTPHAAETLIPYVRSVVVAKRSWGMTPVARILTALARAGVRPRALLVNCPSYEPTHTPVFASSLTHLTLELHNDMRAAPLIEYICAFPRLEVLDVGGSARFAFDEGMLSAHYAGRMQLPARLHTLIVRNTVVVDWIVATALAPGGSKIGVTTLVVRHIRLPEQWEGVYRYLTTSACAGVIRSLTFQGCDFPLQPPTPLPLLPSLRTLTIECSTTATGAHLSMLLPHVPPHITPTSFLPALEVFTLRSTNAFLSAASPSSAVGDPRAWADVDKHFASLSPAPEFFPALERVCVSRVGLSASVGGGRRNSNAEVYGGRGREGGYSVHNRSGTGNAGEQEEEGRSLPKSVADILRKEMRECVRRGLLFV
ncbi:hypothetical protein FB45DRAFT_937299 [Roridomyces roridus]|uniref:F-box domain-containing protein n=1 Tax=Roridomyces roridus TaxID=1738132 RepID=A0AAD7FE17_9AGAR|nr:hypothetical protein FB45DRAFT_937299 [Roridomyces roridus]